MNISADTGVHYSIDNTPDQIHSALRKTEIEGDMLPFINTEFVAPDLPDTIHAPNLEWPPVNANLERKTLKYENNPLHELKRDSRGMLDYDEHYLIQVITLAAASTRDTSSHSFLAVPASSSPVNSDIRIYVVDDLPVENGE